MAEEPEALEGWTGNVYY